MKQIQQVNLQQTSSLQQEKPQPTQMQQASQQQQKPKIHFNPSQAPKTLSWHADPNRISGMKAEFQRKLTTIVGKANETTVYDPELTQSYESAVSQMHTQQINFPIDDAENLFRNVDFPNCTQRDMITGFSRPSSVDSHGSTLWQQRANSTHHIVKFDSTFNGPNFSMYIHSSPSNPKRVITLLKNGSWATISLNTQDIIESCTSDSDYIAI